MYDSDASELAFYRKLLGSVDAAIYVMNLDPYRMDWISNNVFIPRVMKYSHEELISQGDFIAGRVLELPDFKESVVLAIERFRKDPETSLSGVFRIRDANEEVQWILYTQSVIEKDSKGMPTKAAVVALDPSGLLNTPKSLDAFISHLRQDRYRSTKKSLTSKQSKVVQLLLENMSVPEIAETMQLSVHTIKDHKKSIFKKLGCSNVNELFAVADKYNLGG